MKTVSPELETALGENLTFLCRLWTITRKDGTVYRFTDHDTHLTFEGNIYRSDASFTSSAVQTGSNAASANMDVTVLLSDEAIRYADVERGMFDDAPVTLNIVSYRNLTAGPLVLFVGTVLSVALPNKYVAVLALTGKVAQTAKPLNERYSATCRASFGDSKCGVNLAAHTTAFTVTAITTPLKFSAAALAASPDNIYVLGVIEWLTGANVGTRVEVSSNTGGAITIMFKPPFPVQIGDTAKIVRGCAKTVTACSGYANLPNYRGEPFVPGDAGLRY